MEDGSVCAHGDPVVGVREGNREQPDAVPLGCIVQVSPPSVVRKMIPTLPTTVPMVASTKETPYSPL